MTPPGSLPQTPAPARPASGRPGGSRHQGGLLSANTRLAHAASSDVARRSQSVPAGWRRARQGDPMGRRPTDYTAQMQAAEQRKRLREEREREEHEQRVAGYLAARTQCDALADSLATAVAWKADADRDFDVACSD